MGGRTIEKRSHLVTKVVPFKQMNLKDYLKELGDGIREGKGLTGKGGVLTPLIKKVIEASLDGE